MTSIVQKHRHVDMKNAFFLPELDTEKAFLRLLNPCGHHEHIYIGG